MLTPRDESVSDSPFSSPSKRYRFPAQGDDGLGLFPHFGPSQGDATLSLDGLFNSDQQDGLVLPRIQLPPIPALQSNPVAQRPSDVVRSHSMNGSSFRNCCFYRPEIPQGPPEVIRRKIEEMIGFMVEAKVKGNPQALVLTSNPTYFLNKTGPGIWIVLTGNSNRKEQWDNVCQLIGAASMRLVHHQAGLGRNGHGYFSVGKLFEMSQSEVNELFMNVVQCKALPTSTQKRKRRTKAELEAALDSEQPRGKKRGAEHDRDDTGDSPEKKRGKRGGADVLSAQSPLAKSQQRYTVLRGGAGKTPDRPKVDMSPKEPHPVLSPVPARQVKPLTLFQEGIPMLCQRFVRDPSAVENVQSFLENLKKELGGSESQYFSILTGSFPRDLLLRTLSLQTTIVLALRQAYQIPVQTLTLVGIVKENAAWSALQTNDPGTYDSMVGSLDDIVKALDNAFVQQAFALFDPVSCSWFLSVHVLSALLSRHDKNPVLYHTVKAMAQDFHRFTDAIYMMSQFIRVFVGDVDPEIQQLLAPKDVSMQQFWEQTAPPCVSEFVADEILSEMKNRRKARFVKMAIEVVKEHIGVGQDPLEAQTNFNLMQTSMTFLRGVNAQDRLFIALSNAHEDIRATKELYKIILGAKALS